MVAGSGNQSWFVPPVDFLKELPADAFNSLCAKANRTELKAGDVLFRQDDPADYLYVVMSGTLGVLLQQSATEARRLIALVKKGEVIGEVAVVGGGNRSADVVALRDTDLLRINRLDFERLVEKFPKVALTVARVLAARFTEITRSPTIKIVPKVISFITASDGVDAVDAAFRISKLLKAEYGYKVYIQQDRDEELDSERLGNLEDTHDLVILCASPDETNWMSRCTRQSDRICLIANGDQPLYSQLKGRFLGKAHEQQMVDLFLLHSETQVCPLNTEDLLKSISVNRYFHIRSALRTEWSRWGRILIGRGVGLVFSGGGARAYAHIGVLQALTEAGVPIDFVAGSSMGGVIAAGLAIGWSVEEMRERVRDSFVISNPLSDYTLPLKGLVAGRKVERLLEENFGTRDIPDLWLPFLCVSSNLTTAGVHVHETGQLRHALRASISLPGILPPVVIPEGVLVDGAAINNLPTIELGRICHGPLIAVDVSRDLALSPEQWNSHLKKPLWYRMIRPPVIGLLLRSGTVSGETQYRQLAEAAHVNVNPPLGEIDIRNWKLFDRTIELGYQHTVELLENDEVLKSLKGGVMPEQTVGPMVVD